MIPNIHLYDKSGCSICGKEQTKEKTSYSLDKFIKESIRIHGDKYDYSKVKFVDMITLITIICPEHGQSKQTPNYHIRSFGCIKCGLIIKGNGNRYTKEVFLEKAIKKHGHKYDYKLVSYNISKNKIKIICQKHGVFSQLLSSHLIGRGCPKCKGKGMSTKDIIKRFKEIHKNKYDYSLVNFVHTKKKIKIVCSKHGIFNQTPNSHLLGGGCASCKESKGEKFINNLLKKQKIKFKRQKKFSDCINPITKNKLRFDFYIYNINTCIEYDGEQHFKSSNFFGGDEGFKQTKYRDGIKNEYCKNKNIRLLRIKYNQDIENVLKENKII